MSYTGINLENVKNNNRSAILKLLNDQGAMSRKDVAAHLGLTPATVSVICAELMTSNVLCELGEMQEGRRAGRKKMLIGINYDRFRVLSISIEYSETCIYVTNLQGESGVSRRLKTDVTIPPEEFLQRVADECKALMWEADVDKSALLGVGISVPGIVDRKDGCNTYAYRLWENPVNVKAFMEGCLDLPVIVENNVRAFAEAELIFGKGKEKENLLFVKWGPGVGSSMVIHKKIYESTRSQSAEIGHSIMDPKGKLCRCGRRGCLETYVSTHAMAEQLRNHCTEEEMPELFAHVGGDLEKINAHTFEECLNAGGSAVWSVLRNELSMLAGCVTNVIAMLDPDQVILFGKLFDQEKMMEQYMKAAQEMDPRNTDEYMIRSELSDRIDYIGPLAIVVNELFLSGK